MWGHTITPRAPPSRHVPFVCRAIALEGPPPVFPEKAGIQRADSPMERCQTRGISWVPASAGTACTCEGRGRVCPWRHRKFQMRLPCLHLLYLPMLRFHPLPWILVLQRRIQGGVPTCVRRAARRLLGHSCSLIPAVQSTPNLPLGLPT